MTPHYQDDLVTLYAGDCLDVLRELPDGSVDAVVTDPPYELGFMGKRWDASGIAYNVDLWRDVLRVLKPGGHLLAFGGTRTWHRLACAIEDADFEIRDSIAWMYGSGFPKSLDVSKAIDKAAGAERTQRIGPSYKVPNAKAVNPHFIAIADRRDDRPAEIDYAPTAPATDAARRWQGWGTALKPAHEPIVVARKPLTGTVAANVLEHGTGALNIDGCRIAYASDDDKAAALSGDAFKRKDTSDKGWSRPWMEDPDRVAQMNLEAKQRAQAGRWPANVVLDEHQAAELDRQSGDIRANRSVRDPNGSLGYHGGAKGLPDVVSGYEDTGGASRFFYIAKASSAERPRIGDGTESGVHNNRCGHCGRTDLSGTPCQCDQPDWIPRTGGTVVAHPTVKPVDLMRWLVRLVTPPGGTVLEPFAGSGTTAEACVIEGFHCIAIEREADYLPLIVQRLTKPIQPTLGDL